MKLGFIGTGNMGSILIQAFLAAGVDPNRVWITNRNLEKAKALANQYEGIHCKKRNVEVAAEADVLFLCVKPKEYENVVKEIEGICREEQYMVVITSPISLSWLEDRVPCKLVKMIPTINHLVHRGTSLIQFHSLCTLDDRKILLEVFQKISTPLEIEESFVRICSDLSSCSPAFLSFILEQWTEAAHLETGISKEAATFLLAQSIIGMGKLLEQEVFTLTTLQQKICVPGGVTGEGIEAFRPHLLPLFRHVIQTTHRKHRLDQAELMEHDK
ncbi:late competence protein ComER [Rubeoparvulum massiliense]|uniref:late competence protein ComER n=1 Tax=Rubeoparvulum massiliense TaxID=1631346 RepID=UPI00065E4953|nr:late competence protein ComER [Rubeoparvulum massiliense]